MNFKDAQFDTRGVGRWDVGSTRYVPVSGGSRSRLPVIYAGYEDIRKYFGGVGMDERLTDSLVTIGALYSYLGGGILVNAQTAGYIGRLLEQSAKWMQDAVQEG